MRSAARLALAVAVATAASRADAFPAFARKYGMSCSACHVAWPIFNQVGQNFRDNGYQFGLGKDDPITLTPGYIPIALRTTPAYTYTRTTNQFSQQGPTTIQQGGVPLPPGVDILTGGVIAKDLSFLLVVSGFGPDGGASVESGWVRFDNLAGSGWLNVKIGKFELDEPASAHRGVSLLYGYAGYGAHPQGSRVAFDMGENQVGVEIDGHDARSYTRYSLSFTSVNGHEGLSGNAWSAPMVYGHVQQAFDLNNPVVPWIRVGALAGAGWVPTAFKQDADGNDIPGTGSDHKMFSRAGAEVSWFFGYPSTPAFFTVAYIYGNDSGGLIPVDPGGGTIDPYTGAELGGQANSFNSGFVEVDWVPWSEPRYDATPWLFFGRYDTVKFKKGTGDTTGGTIGVRKYLALGPRAAAAIHLEAHYDKVKGVGASADPTVVKDVETTSVLAGVDFDF